MQEFDVAVVGGGLVGASLARALAGSGISCVVIDHQPADSLYLPVLDNRGLALSYGSIQILQRLGVWPQLTAAANVIKSVHVSEQGCFGFSRLNASKLNLPALGYVVSASSLGAVLMQNLPDLAGITVLRPARIKNAAYSVSHTSWELELENQKLTAKLLIAADGTDSALRKQANISVSTNDFHQSALVTNITVQQMTTDIAYERFCAQGVLALLPFGAQQVKCVFTFNNDQVAKYKNMSDVEFLQFVQHIFGFRLGKLIAADKRYIFPIQHLQADKLYSDGLVLLGNAANTLHPVAAQGFNLGLRDVITLAQILIDSKLGINDPSLLKEYAASRFKDHNDTQNYTNSLVNIFASEQPLIKLSRRVGLLAAQFVPGLNNRITTQGLGSWTL